MILAKELRIGNWLQTTDVKRKGQIIWFNPLAVKLRCDYSTLTIRSKGKLKGIDADPVQLTPEILMKCGFKEEKPNWFIFQPELQNVEYRLKWFEGWIFFRGFGEKWNDEIANINYLHQLQNLYYALTGDELNYKP